MKRTIPWLFLAALTLGSGCGNDEAPAKPLAPESKALTAAPPPPAAVQSAKTFAIDKASSKVEFLMDAPREKILGKVHGASTGELRVDLDDVSKSTGLLTVDLSNLELYQTAIDGKGHPGKEEKIEKQNEHARNWLEIGKDAPAEMREKYSQVQFLIRSVTVEGEKSLTKMTGAERRVALKATGDFLLHGRKAEKTAELLATFKFEGDRPVSVHFKSTRPMAVDLAEHDVKPRDAFGKLALKTLADLAPKVAREAPITIDLTAKLAEGAQPAGAAKPGP